MKLLEKIFISTIILIFCFGLVNAVFVQPIKPTTENSQQPLSQTNVSNIVIINITNNITNNITQFTYFNFTNNITNNITSYNNVTVIVENNITNNVTTYQNVTNNISNNFYSAWLTIENNVTTYQNVTVQVDNNITNNITTYVTSENYNNVTVEVINYLNITLNTTENSNVSLNILNITNIYNYSNSYYNYVTSIDNYLITPINTTYIYLNESRLNTSINNICNLLIQNTTKNKIYRNATSYYAYTGTINGLSSDNIINLSNYYDNKYMTIIEQSTIAFNVTFNISNVTNLNMIISNFHYDGSGTHYLIVSLWNYNTSSWNTLGTYIGDNPTLLFETYNYIIPQVYKNNYISNGITQINYGHYGSGQSSHRLYIDYLAIED